MKFQNSVDIKSFKSAEAGYCWLRNFKTMCLAHVCTCQRKLYRYMKTISIYENYIDIW